MLTMTVMQHEREAVEPFATEPAEAKDVLSQLRHLHHTLQECNWRVQVVDHALCTQGHHGQQNQTETDCSFEIQASKDCSPHNESKENYNLQLELEKDSNPQSKAEKDLDLKEQFRETIDSKEQLEDEGLQNQPNDELNWQNGNRDESENQSCEDNHQKPTEENHSIVDIINEHQKLSVQADSDNVQDLHNDTKKNLDNTTYDSNLSNLAMSDHIPHNYAKKDNYIHNETKEESDIQESIKNPCCLHDTYSLEKNRNKYLTRQECMVKDDDPLPTDSMYFLSPITWPSHISSDPNADEISPASGTMIDVCGQTLQFTNLNVKLAEKILKQENLPKRHLSGEVRYRPDSMQDVENKICHEGDIDLYKKQKKDNMSQGHQQKSKDFGKLSLVCSSPEAAQRMDVIWEALENVRSHFFALHSSLVDSSNLFCTQEFPDLSDNSYDTKRESDKVTKCTKLHAMHEDLTSETTQLCEQSSQRKLPIRSHPHCVCQDLLKNQTSSHTPLEEAANSAALSDNSTQTRTYLQVWRKSCLCIVMIVLLVLLFLFLASCLLLVLPVVSVSVRTAGGLPAF